MVISERSARALRRRAFGLAFAIAPLSSAIVIGTAHASDTEKAAAVHLVYASNGDCPNADAFAIELRKRNSRATLVGDDRPARLLEIVLTTRGAASTAHLVLRELDGTETTRDVAGASCFEVAAAMAFVASVAIDSPATEPVHAASAPAPPAASAAADSGAPPAASSVAAVAVDGPVRQALRPFTIAVGVDTQVGSGATPGVMFVVPIFVDIASSTHTGFAPSARVRFAHAESSSHLSNAGASFSWNAGTLDVCPLTAAAAALHFDACARGEAGVVGGAGTGVEPARSATRPWWSAGAATRGRARVAGPIFAELEATLQAPISRDRFTVEPDVTLFRAPPVSWGAAVGLGGVVW